MNASKLSIRAHFRERHAGLPSTATKRPTVVRRIAPFVMLSTAFLAITLEFAPAQGAENPGTLQDRPAVVLPWADQAAILGTARAGRRIVGVGNHGVVLLSDDDGRTFRQAKAVPTRATLTSVSFINEREGWSVGHSSVILHSVDGGESWQVQRRDTSVDRPLFSVLFLDSKQGLAVGLWAQVLRTTDGGASWQAVDLSALAGGKKFDKNLFSLFRDPSGAVYVAAERGVVLKSGDGGRTWSSLDTGNSGSFWTGLVTKEGALLVAGLRGRLFRGEAAGTRWTEVATGTKSSITGLVQLSSGKILSVGLDGVMLESEDDGRSFKPTAGDSRPALSAVVENALGEAVFFSEQGPWVPTAAAQISDKEVGKAR